MSLTDALLLDPHPFDVFIAYRTDSVKGSGTLNDPWNGNGATNFDQVMRDLPTTVPVQVHLGPGTFQTQGFYEGAASNYGWRPFPKLKIIGSGIDATTLQLVNGSVGSKHYFAIGHELSVSGAPNLVDYLEISDLTIDANLSANSGSSAFGAIRVVGSHVRIARVKAKGWGTRNGSFPCFAVAVITADRSGGLVETINAGIEDCIVVEPDASASNVGPATALHAGGKENALANAEGYGKGPYIRNCFVDCGQMTAFSKDFRGLSMGWCRAGLVEGNQVHNTKIGGPYQDKTSTREIVVRNNFYKNVAKGCFWNLGTLNSIGTGTFTRTGTVMTVTITSHPLLLGERVKMTASDSALSGTYRVTGVGGNTFTVTVPNAGATSGSITSAEKVFGLDKLVIEANTFELASGDTTPVESDFAIQVADTEADATATEQTPDYRHGEIIIRENKIRYVDGLFDSTWDRTGIKVAGAKNVIVRENIVECAPTNPLKDYRCGAVTYFHNTTPASALIQGYEGVAQTKYSELETEAEDALLLNLI